MEILFTTTSGYRLPKVLSPLREEASPEWARKHGLVEGVPFVLDEDGVYQVDLNRYFADLARTARTQSPNTWAAYARDIVMFARFLSARGRSLWQPAESDVVEYYAHRRGAYSAGRLSPESWNRTVAALESLYRWAEKRGLITAKPFQYDERPGREAVPEWKNRGKKNASLEKLGEGIVEFVSRERYCLWRDIGLLGRLPGGAPDTSWRGRNPHRNATMADFLVTTGMRITEAGASCRVNSPMWAASRSWRTRSPSTSDSRRSARRAAAGGRCTSHCRRSGRFSPTKRSSVRWPSPAGWTMEDCTQLSAGPSR